MNCYTLFDLLDIVVFIMLCITSIYAWRIYCKIAAPQVFYLFLGFLLSAILQIGFVVISFMPLGGESTITNRFIAELTVALRALPIAFIMFGTINLFKVVVKYISGNGEQKRRSTDGV
jgi:hypothetical protein